MQEKELNGGWIDIDTGELPPDHALCVFYKPFGKYIWGVGSDRSQIMAEYPGVLKYKIVTQPPLED